MILLALVITGIAYFVFPLIYVHTNGKVDNKKAWKIAIINFIICHMIFIGIAVSVGMDGGSASAAPVLWLFLTQAYLHDKNKDGLVAQKKKELPKPTPEHKNYQAKTTSDFKTKMMNVSKDLIYKWAVAGVIITAIVIFIFAMSLGDAKKFGERDICESATTITTTGNNSFQYRSINKNYTVYMIATGNEYIFGKSKNTIYIVMLIQAGGCNGIDSALITVIDLNIYTIEFKEPGAKTSEPDLPKYKEEGNILITEDFKERYPQFTQMLEEQKGLNFFVKMGSNENNFSVESVNIAVTNNYTKKYADVVCTEDINGYLVMLPVNQLSQWAEIVGEIRPAGRNHYNVWTPKALHNFLVELGANIENDIVSIETTKLGVRRERGGDGKISGYKINPL
ncbi:MAG: hypothetical protein PHN55_12570, partial [Dysgonamonadaceae bacterium]|nr:hypothetical protein [Dysgonamonadaceae bacterium]